MLLWNLHAGPGNGFHNGTRMIILQLGDWVIEVEIASGVNKRKVCVDSLHYTHSFRQ